MELRVRMALAVPPPLSQGKRVAAHASDYLSAAAAPRWTC